MPPVRSQLTLAQLSEFDDILTDSLIDRIYYWTRVRKMKESYLPNRGVKTNTIANIIVEDVVRNKNVSKALHSFLELNGIRAFTGKLNKSGHLRDSFEKHARRYLSIYLPDAGFEVSATNRYTLTGLESCIIARRPFKRGETIKYLTGIMLKMSPQEEKLYTKNKSDFSIIYSTRVGGMSLLLGPARFVNHDCYPNSKFVTTNKENIQLIAQEDIDVGDEITVSYAEDYFGEGNQECLCRSCEREVKNGWSSDGDTAPLDDESTPTENIPEAPGMVRTRSKRRSSERDSAEFLPPEKRIKRRPARLDMLTPPDSDRGGSEDISASSIAHYDQRRVSASYSSLSGLENPTISEIGQTTPVRKTTFIEQDPEAADIAQSLLALAQSPGYHRPLENGTSLQVFRESISFGGLLRAAHNNPGVPQGQHDSQIPPNSATMGPGGVSMSRSLGTPGPDPVHASNTKEPLPTPDEADCVTAEPRITRSGSPCDSSSELSEISDSELKKLGQVDQAHAYKGTQHHARSKSQVKETPTKQRRRTPGDYLTAFDSDCIKCTCLDCGEGFVHNDRWYVPRSCQRCERHSRIYGLVWPKTIKRKGDAEDIIEDPRVVQRYVTASEYRKELKRKAQFSEDVTPSSKPNKRRGLK